MWVARMKIVDGTLIEKDLSPRFKSIYDCQKYIDDNLKCLENMLRDVQNFIDMDIDGKLVIRFGNFIRCYNLEQKRFCNGFDF